MGIEQEIASIREGLAAGRFANEAAVSQGIVLRLLHALSWPAYDTQVVWPEYTLEHDRFKLKRSCSNALCSRGRFTSETASTSDDRALSGKRVDFALCHPPGKPIVLIEVKDVGKSDGAERQLFEYAFHHGAPMVILTDGREWNFFLPGEQGDYGERRVYKLDIVERDVVESASRLRRYLLHDDVATGQAIQSARDDYRNVSRERQMSFQDLIRSGNAQELLLGDWPKWRHYRDLHARTSHTYAAKVAIEVVEGIPEFVAEAEFLRDTLARRLA